MMVGEVSSNSSCFSGNSGSEWDYLESQDERKWSEPPSSATAESDFSTVSAAQRYAQQQPPPTSSPQGHQQDRSSQQPNRHGLAPMMMPPAGRGFGHNNNNNHHINHHEHGQSMMNRTAIELLSPAISNSHDALHLLSEAAGRTEDLNRQIYRSNRRLASSSSPSLSNTFSSSGSPATASAAGTDREVPRSAPASSFRNPYFQDDGQFRSRIDSVVDAGHADAVKVWSRLRFVRAGWLTVEEAMAYVAYYYDYLAPLSPIVIPDFSDPSTHLTLLTEEPVLAVTMLTMASRHKKPEGDGAYSRAFYIHDRLWSYLRDMIERLFWGQERFGGGTAGVGLSNRPRSSPLDISSTCSSASNGSLRSLGTVEALLILTDWHPRNLNFPPGDDENALLDLDVHALAQQQQHYRGDSYRMDGGGGSSSSSGDGRLAFQKWLEPAWRSDRMSWMLLSIAQALAFELGVFDQQNSDAASTSMREQRESPSDQRRKRRLRRLILVYVTQSSGRLGIPSMLPLPQWGLEGQLAAADQARSRENYEDEVMVDRMQDCWIGISKIMYQSNHVLFASMEQTSELIRTGRYQEQIDRFVPYLNEFRRNLDQIKRGLFYSVFLLFFFFFFFAFFLSD